MTETDALKISAFYRAVDLRSDSIGRLPVAVKDLRVRPGSPGPLSWPRSLGAAQ